MADIKVKDVRVTGGSDQVAGREFEVTVIPNNVEINPPIGGGCKLDVDGTTVKGHSATMSMDIIDDNGNTVEEYVTSFCAPTEAYFSDLEAAVTFYVTINEKGRYVARITIEDDAEGKTYTDDIEIIVSESPTGREPGEPEPPDDDNGGFNLTEFVVKNPGKTVVGAGAVYFVLTTATETATEEVV